MVSSASAAGASLPLAVVVSTPGTPQHAGGGAAPTYGDAQLVIVDGTTSLRDAVIAARNAILRRQQQTDDESAARGRQPQAVNGQQQLALQAGPNPAFGLLTEQVMRRYQQRRDPNFIDNGVQYAKPSQLFARQI